MLHLLPLDGFNHEASSRCPCGPVLTDTDDGGKTWAHRIAADAVPPVTTLPVEGGD